MAKETNQKKSGVRIALLRKLTVAPEARNEPEKGAYPGGRIKRFFDVFKSNYSNLTIVNGLALIFFLPTIALMLYFMLVGMENFAYKLENMQTPYLIANFGIGLSAGVSPIDTKLAMLVGYRILSLGVFVGLLIFSVGVSGVIYITTKLVWGESFITKKDKFGNDVPRMVIEYFRGVKQYWLETLAYFAVLGLILLGGVNMIITFIGATYLGNANALHYIGLILVSIIMLFALMMFINLIPTVVSFKTRVFDKVKNACIFTMTLTIPNLFILIFFFAPFALMLINSVVAVIVTIALVMFGISFYTLMFVNYADNNSEKIIQPIYHAQHNEGSKKQKKKKKG